MYLAREIVGGRPTYFIRESCPEGPTWVSRDLFALGSDPSGWIHYPGGNAYYIDEAVEEALAARGVRPTQEELEEVFWPFLDARVRALIERFHTHRKPDQAFVRYGPDELRRMQEGVHEFDKRRLLFLRHGEADPRRIPHQPLRLYNRLLGKSRDEIEQAMERIEEALRPGDRKRYVYAIFFLARFFESPLAGRHPGAMDPERMDEALLEEVCRLQQDPTLFAQAGVRGALHPSLVRYLILYFDSEFPSEHPYAGAVEDFIRRNRAYRPPRRRRRLSLEEACRILEIDPMALPAYSPRRLSRHYRKMALACHPDRGGTHERFIRLTRAYRELIAAAKSSRTATS